MVSGKKKYELVPMCMITYILADHLIIRGRSFMAGGRDSLLWTEATALMKSHVSNLLVDAAILPCG